MSLTGETRWKEEFIISNEEGLSFTFDCGWGVDPPSAYVPSSADWSRCVPGWLAERREEVLKIMRAQQHIVRESPYPDYAESASRR
jgi:hypothetical protein